MIRIKEFRMDTSPVNKGKRLQCSLHCIVVFLKQNPIVTIFSLSDFSPSVNPINGGNEGENYQLFSQSAEYTSINLAVSTTITS